MIHNLQALGACFAICVLTLIGTTQGTSYPAPKCCSIAIPIEGLCICKPGYHDDGIRHCVEKAKFQFARSSYIVKENSVTVKLQVDRLRGGHSGPVKVNWRATGITATANQDFRDLAGTLEFKANENWKVISITIIDDRIYELTEKFKVTLTSTSATGELGPRSFTFVSILDNDPKAKFQFKLTSVQARENCKTLKLQVDRIAGGSTGPATVIWKATGITATPGKDFLDLSGKLYFKANENWKVISIRIVDDRITEPTERFRVTLFSSSTVEIGPNRFADVSILDNDRTFYYYMSIIGNGQV
ncbi:sodium/calcium exchanger 1-like [Argopecten irradians]|uniref:sodium/calcium exchanger 1-like n=1 Tax=Argopecten irradians TaxID=31199 RepID=UPI00371803F0